MRWRFLRFPALYIFESSIFFALVSGCSPSSCGPGVRIEGRENQIASGQFRRLGVSPSYGTEEIPAYVLALREPDETGGRLTMIPFEGGSECDAGRATIYRVLARKDPASGNYQERVWVFNSPGGSESATVRFTDLECHEQPPSLEGVDLPDSVYVFTRLDIGDVAAVFLLTVSGELHLLDPWEGTSALLAAGVSQIERQRGADRLWLVDRGRLMVLDFNGDQLASVGTSVTGFSLHQDPPEAALVDGQLLYVLDGPGGEPVHLDNDACEPNYLVPVKMDPDQPILLSYLSPCATRQLVVLNRDTGERSTYGDGVGSALWVGEMLFYVTGTAGAMVGELWAAPLGGAPVRVGPNGRFYKIYPVVPDRFLVLLDYDGGMGRLGLWSVGEGFTEIRDGVASILPLEFSPCSSFAVLCDYDGSTGTLFFLDMADLTMERIASGVTIGAFSESFLFPGSDYIAFLGEYDGAAGKLFLLDTSSKEVETIASGVPPDGFQLSVVAPALGYLDEFDPQDGVGRLRAWVIPTKEIIEVDTDVAEFREVGWPAWGILYAIGRGDAAGIWFAEVELE
jgi:hypothetical protein